MDAHFREYLAAVAGMQEIYGFNDHAGVEVADAVACHGGESASAEEVANFATAS
jgi:hypothetical protein